MSDDIDELLGITSVFSDLFQSLDCMLTGWLDFIQNTETVNVQNEELVDKQLAAFMQTCVCLDSGQILAGIC